MIKKYQSAFLAYSAVLLTSFVLFSAFIISANQTDGKEQVYEMTDHTISTKAEQKAEREGYIKADGEQESKPLIAVLH
ncbi:hypothetical protein CD149_12425 [Staphylococcus condimenti]|uniref:Uncharacterized protein n=1 Tax=Staphylococcus condimenti TaxID=70255 RepID=A0A143P8L7_9STAP|nr:MULTISPECIES: DNA damage-induced cell division inhibitor SosA [Staphylococcus]AMY04865.1 hypothetical protein A4G25_02560 [Staphylococcus condimenti]APR61109.1 hypothetical protein BTZ13_07815 [Staphylococcus condimenti]MDK8644139.1 DNA damage-induced cell division inhibitor SosA [Staphylococcus condimenti]OFP01091.1 hypothetical protein HMPREF3007_10085 [Staphylococcus sp. HMSC065E08]PNZ56969.1 hypothetical protein CD149_12425 [Staphylococcus condimenti]